MPLIPNSKFIKLLPDISFETFKEYIIRLTKSFNDWYGSKGQFSIRYFYCNKNNRIKRDINNIITDIYPNIKAEQTDFFDVRIKSGRRREEWNADFFFTIIPNLYMNLMNVSPEDQQQDVERDFIKYLVKNKLADYGSYSPNSVPIGTITGQYFINKIRSCCGVGGFYDVFFKKPYKENDFVNSVKSVLQTHWQTDNSDSVIEIADDEELKYVIRKCDVLLSEVLGEKQFEKILSCYKAPAS